MFLTWQCYMCTYVFFFLYKCSYSGELYEAIAYTTHKGIEAHFKACPSEELEQAGHLIPFSDWVRVCRSLVSSWLAACVYLDLHRERTLSRRGRRFGLTPSDAQVTVVGHKRERIKCMSWHRDRERVMLWKDQDRWFVFFYYYYYIYNL